MGTWCKRLTECSVAKDTLNGVEKLSTKIGEAVCKAFEMTVIENGHMTKQQATTLILQGQEDTKSYVGGRIEELKTAVTVAIQNLAQPETRNAADTDNAIDGADNGPDGPDGFADGEEEAQQPAGEGARFRTYAQDG